MANFNCIVFSSNILDFKRGINIDSNIYPHLGGTMYFTSTNSIKSKFVFHFYKYEQAGSLSQTKKLILMKQEIINEKIAWHFCNSFILFSY